MSERATICPECGSGILDGEHIADYPCPAPAVSADTPEDELVSAKAMTGLRLIARKLDCNIAAALEVAVAEFEIPAAVSADTRLIEAAERVAASESADDDWEVVRASDLQALRDTLAAVRGGEPA